MNILMVLTSHDKLGDTGKKTGFWLEEFAAPYYAFLDFSRLISNYDCNLRCRNNHYYYDCRAIVRKRLPVSLRSEEKKQTLQLNFLNDS